MSLSERVDDYFNDLPEADSKSDDWLDPINPEWKGDSNDNERQNYSDIRDSLAEIMSANTYRNAFDLDWGKTFTLWQDHPAAEKEYDPNNYPSYGEGTAESYDLKELYGIEYGKIDHENAIMDGLSRSGKDLTDEILKLSSFLRSNWNAPSSAKAQGVYDTLATEIIPEFRAAIDTYSHETNQLSKESSSLVAQLNKKLYTSEFARLYYYGAGKPGAHARWSLCWDIHAMQNRVNTPYPREELYSKTNPYSPFGRAVLGRSANSSEPTVKIEWSDLKLVGSPSIPEGWWFAYPLHDIIPDRKIRQLDEFCGWYVHAIDGLRQQIHHDHEEHKKHYEELARILRQKNDHIGQLTKRLTDIHTDVPDSQEITYPSPDAKEEIGKRTSDMSDALETMESYASTEKTTSSSFGFLGTREQGSHIGRLHVEGRTLRYEFVAKLRTTINFLNKEVFKALVHMYRTDSEHHFQRPG